MLDNMDEQEKMELRPKYSAFLSVYLVIQPQYSKYK